MDSGDGQFHLRCDSHDRQVRERERESERGRGNRDTVRKGRQNSERSQERERGRGRRWAGPGAVEVCPGGGLGRSRVHGGALVLAGARFSRSSVSMDGERERERERGEGSSERKTNHSLFRRVPLPFGLQSQVDNGYYAACTQPLPLRSLHLHSPHAGEATGSYWYSPRRPMDQGQNLHPNF